MTLMKSLLLGSAAALVTVAGAQAADLPTKKGAPAAEYVKICQDHRERHPDRRLRPAGLGHLLQDQRRGVRPLFDGFGHQRVHLCQQQDCGQ